MLKENSNSERKSYSLSNNNCGTFAYDVLNQDPDVKDKVPSIIDPRPNSIIDEYQGTFQKIQYDPKTKNAKTNAEKSYYQQILDGIKNFKR